MTPTTGFAQALPFAPTIAEDIMATPSAGCVCVCLHTPMNQRTNQATQSMTKGEKKKRNADNDKGSNQSFLTVLWLVFVITVVAGVTAPTTPTMGGLGRV